MEKEVNDGGLTEFQSTVEASRDELIVSLLRQLKEARRCTLCGDSEACEEVNILTDHKWLDTECGVNGCQSLVWQSRYESAIKGRQDFRRAYSSMRNAWKIAEDALASISGERTPQRFPETSYDLAARALQEARATLAAE